MFTISYTLGKESKKVETRNAADAHSAIRDIRIMGAKDNEIRVSNSLNNDVTKTFVK